MISGLVTPTKGNVFIDGVDVTTHTPQTRGIAFIFQNFEIFPMTLWENTIYSLKVRGFSEKFCIEQGERALKLAGLMDRANEIPTGWSNGDLQKVGLARAICSGAKILIMDEPLGSLDPKVNKVFRWELHRIIKDSGLTAIQVTHDQEEAMSLADKIIVMRDGDLQQEDSQDVLYKTPNSLFVGNFLGGINTLEGYVYHVDYPDTYDIKIRLGGPLFTIKSKTNSKYRFNLDDNVVIAVRYENVFIFPEKYDYKNSRADWEGITLMDGRILEEFLTGKERMYVVELDNGDVLQVKKPHVFQYRFKKREKIRVGLFSDNLLLYPYPKDLKHEIDLQ